MPHWYLAFITDTDRFRTLYLIFLSAAFAAMVVL